jgi:hypothetical protein
MRLSIQFLVSLAAQPSYIMKKIITANTATTQTVQGSDQPQAQRFAPAQLGARSELEKKSTLVVAVVPAVPAPQRARKAKTGRVAQAQQTDDLNGSDWVDEAAPPSTVDGQAVELHSNLTQDLHRILTHPT